MIETVESYILLFAGVFATVVGLIQFLGSLSDRAWVETPVGIILVITGVSMVQASHLLW